MGRYRYEIKELRRAVNLVQDGDWIGGYVIAVETPSVVFCIEMDKPGRSISLGLVQGRLLDEGWEMGRSVIKHQKGPGLFCFDRRLVAMVARMFRDESEDMPKYGEEIPIPTDEETDRIFEELDIATPATNKDSDMILCDSIQVGDDGEPL